MKKRGRVTGMLVSGFLFLFILFQSNSLYAQQTVSMEYWDASFLEVINAFQKQTGVKFLYNLEKVKDKKCKELGLHEVPVNEAIQIVLGAFGFTYSMVEGVVVVNEALSNTIPQNSAVQVITGKVVSTSGEPLPGVTIMLKGTQTGVSSDVNGNFSIMLPGQEVRTLVFSFVGMQTKEVKCTDNKPLTVVLEWQSTELEEASVVSTGYQTINRKDMVGAYTTVKARDIMMPAYTSIDQMLQGKIPGLVMMNTSSRVGRSPKITIRGTSTILGNSDPLWVVDGIIQSDPLPFDASSALTDDLTQMIGNQISWLNPADIETITVLKDASATAVYGSKASNGVIVVTTKKGSAERQSIRYSANFSFRARPNYGMFDYMDSKERIRFSKEAYDAGVRYQNEPIAQIYTYEGLMRLFNERQISEEYFMNRLSELETNNTDWFDVLTQNSFSHNHNLSLSGGTQKVTYNASIGYSNNKGVEIGDEMNQLNARLNVNVQVMKNLKLDVSLSGSRSNSKGFGSGVNPMDYATTTNRSIPAYEDGNLAYYLRRYNYTLNSAPVELGYNIINERENSYARNKASRWDVNINLDWTVTPWLTYQVVGGITDNASEAESYAGEKTTYIARNYRGYDYGSVLPGSELFRAAMLPFGGELFNSHIKSLTYNMQHKVLLSHTFHSDHRINAMLGVEIRSVENKNNSNTIWGYVPERGEKLVMPTPLDELKPVGGVTVPGDWGILDRIYNSGWTNQSLTSNYFSFFVTLAYSLKNKYVFNANLRSDASNRFGQDVSRRYEPTYSLGVSWRVAEEEFLKDRLYWLDQMNFRATWGIQGNVVNTVSPDLIVRQGGVDNVFKQYMVFISSLPNPYLKWEKTKTWNFGLDLQLFKALTLNLEYYGRSSNAIVDQDIAQEYGMTSMQLNGGRINNHGVEFSMNITPFQRKDFAWTIGFNASKNWNKSKSSDAILKKDMVDKGKFLVNDGKRLLKKGYPVTGFWSYDFAGLDHDTGYPVFNRLDIPEEEWSTTIDPTSFLTYSGQTDPYFTGGLNTRIRYKSVSLGADFSLLLGAKTRLPNPYSQFNMGKLPDPYYNLSRNLNKRWKQPGDERYTDIPALFTSISQADYYAKLPDKDIQSVYDMWAYSDAMVVSASFFRCTQLSLSYNMDPKLCARFGATSCTLSANVNNLFVVASKRFQGFDPELGNSVLPKIFSFGLSVGF